VKRICVALLFALFLGSIPIAESCAFPPKQTWTAPDPSVSGGGDDDEPIKASPPAPEADSPVLPIRRARRITHAAEDNLGFWSFVRAQMARLSTRILKL
jgi:hypothetical protein